MANLTEQKPMIRITYDEMEAYILLPEPELDTVYTVPQLMQELAEKGITYGIDM